MLFLAEFRSLRSPELKSAVLRSYCELNRIKHFEIEYEKHAFLTQNQNEYLFNLIVTSDKELRTMRHKGIIQSLMQNVLHPH